MNPVLEEIMLTGETKLPSGLSVPVDSGIDMASGLLLQRAIREIGPKVAVEVGLAFGISTLFMLEALAVRNGRLIGMDPAQNDDHWRGGGLYNIQRSGFADSYEFLEKPSQQVLPQLQREGVEIEFAFIDGWHTFDHTLVDFFYIDMMLTTGGIVVFDDVGYPSVKRVCDFALSNRDYEIYDLLKLKSNRNWRWIWKYYSATILHPIVRTDITPTLKTRRRIKPIKEAYFLALKKQGDDRRRWDHFRHF